MTNTPKHNNHGANNTISTEPLPNSSKTYIKGTLHHDIQVPVRQLSLTNGETITLYDTSGPYTDAQQNINIFAGLPAIREAWINKRNDTELSDNTPPNIIDQHYKAYPKDEPYIKNQNIQRRARRAKSGHNVSQLHYAKQGIITPEMEYVAIRENQHQKENKQASFA